MIKFSLGFMAVNVDLSGIQPDMITNDRCGLSLSESGKPKNSTRSPESSASRLNGCARMSATIALNCSKVACQPNRVLALAVFEAVAGLSMMT